MNKQAIFLAKKLELAILGHSISLDNFYNKIQKAESFYKQGYIFNGICLPPNRLFVNEIFQKIFVIGYPYGDSCQKAKLQDLWSIILTEPKAFIDYVPDFTLILGTDCPAKEFINNLKEIRMATKETELRLIVEVGLLNQLQLNNIISIAEDCNVDVIKTSTGTLKNDASPMERIKRVRHTKLKVKVSGGIKDLQTTKECIDAGADIIGSSLACEILEESLKNL